MLYIIIMNFCYGEFLFSLVIVYLQFHHCMIDFFCLLYYYAMFESNGSVLLWLKKLVLFL